MKRESGRAWILPGISIGLLFASAGLQWYARHGLGEGDVAAMLLALYLAFWSYALGVSGVIALSIFWMVGRRKATVHSVSREPVPAPVDADSEQKPMKAA
jgi:hypothetical protein